MSRDYGVDVAAYQSTSLSGAKSCGAKYAIIKLTEGTGYLNPKAHAQIKSAHANHLYVHAYHFCLFGSNVAQAKKEARFAVNQAEKQGISKSRYIFADWETGDGNNIYGGVNNSTKAVLAFMKVVHDSGYKVGFYSGASVMKNNINTSEIVKKYGTCLWVASYATMGRIDKPNFGYFPSMNGVAIWQFTDNWCGMNVDGNISLIDLHKSSATKTTAVKTQPKKPESKTGTVYAPVINHNSNWKIRLLDGDGHYTNQYIPTNSKWKYFDVKTIKGMKCYKLGTDKQWCPGKFLRVV